MTHYDFRNYAIRRAIQDCDDATKAALQAAIDPDVSLGNNKPMGNIHIMGLDHDGIPLTHVMHCRDIYELSYLARLVNRNRDTIAAIPGAEGVLRAMDEAPAEVLKGLRDACYEVSNDPSCLGNDWLVVGMLEDWIELCRPHVRDAAVIADAKALCMDLTDRFQWSSDFELLTERM